MNRRLHAALIIAHGAPAVIGTLWFQTVGVDAAPGGRWVWLPLLYVLPPLLAAWVTLRPRQGAAASLGYGLVLVAAALATVAWATQAEATRAVARALEWAAVGGGCTLAALAQALRASEAAPRSALAPETDDGRAGDGRWPGVGKIGEVEP